MYKAFSNCGSPLAVVSLLYEVGFGVDFSSVVTEFFTKKVVVSMM
jgi:hypothetical protein